MMIIIIDDINVRGIQTEVKGEVKLETDGIGQARVNANRHRNVGLHVSSSEPETTDT